MKAEAIRKWEWAHKWSSLVCTLFLFLLCLTGLPLIFHDEIDALAGEVPPAGLASALGGKPLDGIVITALAEYKVLANRTGAPLFVGFSANDPLITVTVGPRPDASSSEMQLFSYDRSTGRPLGEVERDGLMAVVLQMHIDMFLGLPGMVFLGCMGLLFVVSFSSGIVLYAPFMRRVPFGALRKGKSHRLGLLDEHNLLGAVTLGWALAIGLTGAINAFADPLIAAWRQQELASMVSQAGTERLANPAHVASLDKALAAAQAAQPGLVPQFIGFPGGAWSSGHHYAIFFQGSTALTSHLLTPALVDAQTARLDDIRPMPFSMQALMLSRPLHFGDYGGISLKIVWALLDLATIRVLWSGLALWWGKRFHRKVAAP